MSIIFLTTFRAFGFAQMGFMLSAIAYYVIAIPLGHHLALSARMGMLVLVLFAWVRYASPSLVP